MSSEPPPNPSFPLPPTPPPEPRSGCLKWGLIGCAVLSVLLIVGIVVFLRNRGVMMDWAFSKMSGPVLSECTADVTKEERQDFEAAFKAFAERAKAGRVSPQEIQGFQHKVMGAVSDGKVTPEELRDLTESLKHSAP